MIPRGKKIPFAIILTCAFGLYLYKMVKVQSSIPTLLRKRFLEHGFQNGRNSSFENNVKYADRNGFSFSSTDSLEIFKQASKCLVDAKKYIAGYLRQANDREAKVVKDNLEPDCSMNYLLIILITTRPGNFANRVAIRMSWGRMDSIVNKHIGKATPGIAWKSIFSVGLATSPNIGDLVTLENEKYKDVLRLPYKDTYKNLPNKTMNSLEWIANNCAATFVLKTDDDCFVNIFQVLPWLQNLPSNYDYIGRVNDQMPVIRDPKHRNFVAIANHKDNFYKPYCAGGGYLLRASLLKNITEVGRRIKQIINEDAYMGMLTNALGIIPRNEERFLPYIFFGPPVKKLNICDWKNQFLIHNVFGKRQLIMHYNSIAMSYFHSLCEKL